MRRPRLHSSLAYNCDVCGKLEEGPPILYAKAPDPWLTATAEERAQGELFPVACVLPSGDRERYFVRGHLDLRVLGTRGALCWCIWAEIDAIQWELLPDTLLSENVQAGPLVGGTLATELYVYPSPTMGLPVLLAGRGPEEPAIEVTAKSHPLFREQRQGIFPSRVREILAQRFGRKPGRR